MRDDATKARALRCDLRLSAQHEDGRRAAPHGARPLCVFQRRCRFVQPRSVYGLARHRRTCHRSAVHNWRTYRQYMMLKKVPSDATVRAEIEMSRAVLEAALGR